MSESRLHAVSGPLCQRCWSGPDTALPSVTRPSGTKKPKTTSAASSSSSCFPNNIVERALRQLLHMQSSSAAIVWTLTASGATQLKLLCNPLRRNWQRNDQVQPGLVLFHASCYFAYFLLKVKVNHFGSFLNNSLRLLIFFLERLSLLSSVGTNKVSCLAFQKASLNINPSVHICRGAGANHQL